MAEAEWHHWQTCIDQGIPPGTPSHVQHDIHRPIGWARQVGHYIDRDMIRVLGIIDEVETDEERASLETIINVYWAAYHERSTKGYQADLLTRTQFVRQPNYIFLHLEAAVIKQTDIARRLYPQYFEDQSSLVDKDGLVDYRVLTEQADEVFPGVFHDKVHDLVLFAHPYFRRSLAHRNKLNQYFLGTFNKISTANRDLRARLKLDPDFLGHPDSAKNLIELEYWHGPKYSDDIASIPNGVTQHKSDDRTRFFEGVDCTQIWWKAPEERSQNNAPSIYRTFEIEELVENPAAGLNAESYGCRYAHAEFSQSESTITHFDGAIRAYAPEAYYKRIDCLIDRAGKQADYTKLFRFDGNLPISDWKTLLGDFFRGNNLIPEYFKGEIDQQDYTVNFEEDGSVSGENATECDSDSTLVAFISLALEQPVEGLVAQRETLWVSEDTSIQCVELGSGATEKAIRSYFQIGDAPLFLRRDGIFNLSRLQFGPSNDLGSQFRLVLCDLSAALDADGRSGLVSKAAVPLAWWVNRMRITLTLAGDVSVVAPALAGVADIVDVEKPPQDWIENIASLVRAFSERSGELSNWHAIEQGILRLGGDTVEFVIQFPHTNTADFDRIRDFARCGIDQPTHPPSSLYVLR